MRVICIETTYYADNQGNDTNSVSLNKGAIYHVLDIIKVKNKLPFADGNWYTLLEAVGAHHESKFLELPDDLFEEQTENKKIYNEQ